MRVGIHKISNQTPKSENQNVAGELQPEKVQTSFHISGGRSLGEVLGCIISFSLLRNLSPGRIERTIMIFSSVSLKILMEVLVTERISCVSRWIFMFVNRQIPLTTRLMSQVQNCGIRRKRWGHRFGLFISIPDHHC